MLANIKNAYGVISLWLLISLITLFFPNSWNYGVIPRSLEGTIGILSSPFFHGGMTHLGSNMFPMYILGSMVGLRMSTEKFFTVTFLLIGTSGVLLWIFGRSAEHIGASGLVFAYFGYLISSWWHGNKGILSTIIVGVILVFYWYLIPSIFIDVLYSSGISWDGHLTGIIGGIIVGKFFNERS